MTGVSATQTITVGDRTFVLLDKGADVADWFKSPEPDAQPLVFKALGGKVASVDEKARTVVHVISNEAKDRDGDVIRVTGWDFKDWKKNPVIQWAHSYGDLPIAKGQTITVDKKDVVSKAQYADAELNPFADQVFRMIAAGFLSATSVGFIPTKAPNEMAQSSDEVAASPWGGYEFIGQSLLEYSVVPVPSNPTALSRAVATGVADPNVLAKMGFEVPREVIDLSSLKPADPASAKDDGPVDPGQRVLDAAAAGDLDTVGTWVKVLTDGVTEGQRLLDEHVATIKDQAAEIARLKRVTTTSATGGNATATTFTFNGESGSWTFDPTPSIKSDSSDAPAEDAEPPADVVRDQAPTEVRAQGISKTEAVEIVTATVEEVLRRFTGRLP